MSTTKVFPRPTVEARVVNYRALLVLYNAVALKN